MRVFTVTCLLVAGLFVALSAYEFAEIHPRRGALWVALAGISLAGAWLSIAAAHHEAKNDHGAMHHS
jgi:hypothetical protein